MGIRPVITWIMSDHHYHKVKVRQDSQKADKVNFFPIFK